MFNKYNNLFALPLALPIAAIIAPAAYATTYMDIPQAQQILFPNEKFTSIHLTLSDEQLNEIEGRSKINVLSRELKIWKTSGGGYFMVDEVIGKHEFITYAIGLDSNGSVKNIEIMQYNETYGDQIRDAKWRAQFAGKAQGAPLKLDQDIKNISGATLSCRHITDGVKRILATYEIAIKTS